MHSKTDIIATASFLFSQRGYHGTTMRELARCLALKEASLYSHIVSKEAMLWEIVNRTADLFLAHAQAIPNHISLPRQLELLVQGHLDIIACHPNDAAVFFHEWKFLPPDQRLQIEQKRDAYEAYFHRVISEGARRALFSVQDTRLATSFVLSVLNWTYQWFRPDGPLSAQQLADQYITFILRALVDY